jgi:dihydropteroate synthase
MGILNVTPDSFYDRGRFSDPEAAMLQARELVNEGASIIDVGGESTHPKSTPVSESEELRRVLPVIERLAADLQIPISIDTQKPGVARAALRAGAAIVNDIAANRSDTEMWELLAETRAGYILMHMQGTPQTMQIHPSYSDVVAEVNGFFANRILRMEQIGVKRDQIILDVGIGFGKTLEHNLELLAGLQTFRGHGRPLALGVSRKSFIGKLLGAQIQDRLPAALACSCLAIEQGVQIVRTHDVSDTLQAVRMTETILARR